MLRSSVVLGAQCPSLFLKLLLLSALSRWKNRDARSDQGYKFRPVVRKTGIVAENDQTKPDRTNAIFHGSR